MMKQLSVNFAEIKLRSILAWKELNFIILNVGRLKVVLKQRKNWINSYKKRLKLKKESKNAGRGQGQEPWTRTDILKELIRLKEKRLELERNFDFDNADSYFEVELELERMLK